MFTLLPLTGDETDANVTTLISETLEESLKITYSLQGHGESDIRGRSDIATLTRAHWFAAKALGVHVWMTASVYCIHELDCSPTCKLRSSSKLPYIYPSI